MASRNGSSNKWNNNTKTPNSAARKRPLCRIRPGNVPTKRFCQLVPTTPKPRMGPRPTNQITPISLEAANIQRGNISVVVRVRPPMNREKGPARRIVVEAIDDHLLVFDPPEEQLGFYHHGVKQKCINVLKKPNKDMKFAFDRVYGSESTNPEIFEGTINPIIETLLEGYSCSVFAYGATGSGKTLQCLEIQKILVYNETIRDLLSTISMGDKENRELDIREHEKGVTVSNLSTHKPKTPEELLRMLSVGNSRRSQHPTDQNAESSRSHAVFQLHINLTHHHTNLQNNFRSAKLVMVDLAGSERGSATGFVGQRFREGAAINKSLLALANCINALADGKIHIPFRDSKLTRILKDALGGKCKTVMIANVSPSDISYEDSFNTLKYANRAKNIRFKIKQNTVTVSARITEYGQIVDEMKQQIETLRKALAEKEAKCTCSCSRTTVECSTELNEHNISFAGNNFDGNYGSTFNVSSSHGP